MKGALLFAFNSPSTDYYKMAVLTAKRINHFLDIPVSVITDDTVDTSNYDYKFDKTIIEVPDKSNTKSKNLWINKGRYKAYDLSPYDETLLIDTDYLVNGNQLLTLFDIYDDIMFPNKVNYLLDEPIQESISLTSYNTLWATVMLFNKSSRAKQLFECMEMVQKNYSHYINLFNIPTGMYRNDYALSFAHRIINGQSEDTRSYMPWNLLHLAKNRKAFKNTTDEFCTEYTIMDDNNKSTYIQIKDTDFHILDKNTFMSLV